MIYNTSIDISGGALNENTKAFLPIEQDIIVTKGSDFIWHIEVSVPEKGLGWNAANTVSEVRMQWRTSIDASTTVPSGGLAAYISFSDSDPENVLIDVHIPASVTDDIVFAAATLGTNQSGFRRGGQGYYDMEVQLNAVGEGAARVFRILEGGVTTSDEVTR